MASARKRAYINRKTDEIENIFMPGIVAIVRSKSNVNLINSMARSITHEKWHKTDLFLKAPLAIGRVHLGTINPEKQLIFNEDKSACIVMDGEVARAQTKPEVEN